MLEEAGLLIATLSLWYGLLAPQATASLSVLVLSFALIDIGITLPQKIQILLLF